MSKKGYQSTTIQKRNKMMDQTRQVDSKVISSLIPAHLKNRKTKIIPLKKRRQSSKGNEHSIASNENKQVQASIHGFESTRTSNCLSQSQVLNQVNLVSIIENKKTDEDSYDQFKNENSSEKNKEEDILFNYLQENLYSNQPSKRFNNQSPASISVGFP